MRKNLSIAIAILLVITGANLFLTRGTSTQTAQDSEQAGSGVAQIGGSFSLTDQNGNSFTESALNGKISLVFFGFTHCPDICPVTLQTYAALLSQLGDKAGKLNPVFITVDPDRDTPEVLKTYLSNLDSRIIGLTGSKEQIAQAAQAYKAYYSVTEESTTATAEDHSAHQHDAHSEHTHAAPAKETKVDHSGFIYLMDSSGKYVRHFAYNASAEEILAALTPLLN